MSNYKQKMDISKALSIVNSMYTVRRKNVRVTSADALETVLFDYYRKCEKLEMIDQILKADFKDINPLDREPYKLFLIKELVEHE